MNGFLKRAGRELWRLKVLIVIVAAMIVLLGSREDERTFLYKLGLVAGFTLLWHLLRSTLFPYLDFKSLLLNETLLQEANERMARMDSIGALALAIFALGRALGAAIVIAALAAAMILGGTLGL